jgi:hypothetical protein
MTVSFTQRGSSVSGKYTVQGHGSITATVIPVEVPQEVLLVPVPGFPISEEEVRPIRDFLQRLGALIAQKWRISSETLIQVEQSDDKECRAIYARNARLWIPEVGLGVWPDREPPAAWTRDDFSNLGPGERLRPLMYQVLRITTSPKARADAASAMLRFGPVLQIMTSDDGETFLSKATAALLPPIKDPSFTCYPFYVPLLESKTITSATPGQLDTWFCGASVYIRESFEDKGILIASRQALTPILEQMGGCYEEKPEPHWDIPV